MEFRFQDFLKMLIPGFIVFLGIWIFISYKYYYCEFENVLNSGYKEYSEILVVVFLIVCYLIGYLNDAISSIFENYIIYKIHKKPSFYLLTNKCKDKFKISDLSSFFQKVHTDYNVIVTNLNQLAFDKKIAEKESSNIFKLINEKASLNEIKKEFYYSYIFSRNLLTAYIVCLIFVIFSQHHIILFEWIAYGFIFFVLWQRRKQTSYYYSRKILLSIYA